MSTNITHLNRHPLNSAIPSIRSDEEEAWLDVVRRQAAGLKFGSVAITIHEGRVVQVETSSKLRFDKH